MQLIVLGLLLCICSGLFRAWVVKKLLVRTKLEESARQTTGSILRYAIITIGFVIILQTAGIEIPSTRRDFVLRGGT